MKTKTIKTRRPSPQRKVTTKSSKENLESIFEDLLKDIYWAEKHLTKALPKMSKASFNEDLKAAFDNHLEVTEHQVKRIEQCFELLDKKALAKKCPAMEGLVKEGKKSLKS